MRFGARLFIDNPTPDTYLAGLKEKGYRAACCPPDLTIHDTQKIAAYRDGFAVNDIVLAEVGAWSSPISVDETEAKRSIEYTCERLALADALGATCCVNILGSLSPVSRSAPCAANFGDDFFAYAVDMARTIVDTVKPKHTKMTFEMMASYFLDCPSEYLRFLKAVDRPAVGVHFDPINCIRTPRMLYDSETFFEEAFALLTDYTFSVHIKDLTFNPDYYTVVLQEMPFGDGDVNLAALLRIINKRADDTCVIIEHEKDEAAFDKAAARLRALATQEGIVL